MAMNGDDVMLALLTGDDALHALVRDRVYADIMPATSVFPLVVYELLAAETERTLADGSAGVDQCRYHVDVWALTRDEARETGDAVRAALDGQRSGAPQYAVDLVSARAGFDETSLLYRVQQEYALSAEEVAP